ncbi:MAG: cytochrome-c peroxidase [Methylococcaceae bacterium]|nr:MAG: cytochrome-c peroxidase [Methylococcaceae bacterium]
MKTLRSIISALLLTGTTVAMAGGNWQTLPETAPAPANNPTTSAKAHLGKMLYHDPRLSASGTVACASCHNVMAGGEDNRAGSVGIRGQVGGRSAPTVWNAAFNSVQFWDGRADSLEAQAKGPVTNPIEMGMKSWDDAIAALKQIPGYKPAFSAAFNSDEITQERVVQAIAAYERTLITPNSPYDRYVKGDSSALTDQQVRGMNTFAEIGCNHCHGGPAFNGPALPQGQGFFMKFPINPNPELESKYELSADSGRAQVTKSADDAHLFKVPTLRNIALTAPYFHNGNVKTLDEAVRVMAKVQLDKNLDDKQVGDITAFLNALTGEFPRQDMPRLPATPGKTFPFE